jgi:hypothetical protein
MSNRQRKKLMQQQHYFQQQQQMQQQQQQQGAPSMSMAAPAMSSNAAPRKVSQLLCMSNLTWVRSPCAHVCVRVHALMCRVRPQWTTDVDVEQLCSPFGKVTMIRFIEDRINGKSKGYARVRGRLPRCAWLTRGVGSTAFVEFEEAEAVSKAAENLHERYGRLQCASKGGSVCVCVGVGVCVRVARLGGWAVLCVCACVRVCAGAFAAVPPHRVVLAPRMPSGARSWRVRARLARVRASAWVGCACVGGGGGGGGGGGVRRVVLSHLVSVTLACACTRCWAMRQHRERTQDSGVRFRHGADAADGRGRIAAARAAWSAGRAPACTRHAAPAGGAANAAAADSERVGPDGLACAADGHDAWRVRLRLGRPRVSACVCVCVCVRACVCACGASLAPPNGLPIGSTVRQRHVSTWRCCARDDDAWRAESYVVAVCRVVRCACL